MSGEDFVNVRLTEFGAGLGQVVVHEGPREFAFKPGSVQRVTRVFEWERILSRQEQDGKKLFEIAPSPSKGPDAGPNKPTPGSPETPDETKPGKKTAPGKDADRT
ncbi:MAG TPA: hypothetical protein VF532_05885 [Candidatus Angelobacter sp.]